MFVGQVEGTMAPGRERGGRAAECVVVCRVACLCCRRRSLSLSALNAWRIANLGCASSLSPR